MAFSSLRGVSIEPRRVLVFGPPNSFKTTSLLTWPRPLHVVNSPGEKGFDTLANPPDDVHPYRWISEKNEDALAQFQAVEKLVFEVLSGAHGPVATFGFEGLHKLYAVILDVVTGGAFGAGEEFDAKLYARAHELFSHFITRAQAAPTPFQVYTAWDGREADSPELAKTMRSAAPAHTYPELPGKMAKRIMGEFSYVLYAESNFEKMTETGVQAKGTWQLLPHGKVWGAAIKAPVSVVQRLPLTIPQSFPLLKLVLEKAWAEGQAPAPATPPATKE